MTGEATMKRSAIISDDGVYRYSLRREWDEHLDAVVFVMLNPSTADADIDDPTIRRCIGFAKRWRKGGIIVVNLFAFRATDPQELGRCDDPVGPKNLVHMEYAVRDRDVVAAWGANPMAAKAATSYAPILRQAKRLDCLGTTKSGEPRHPLYVRADKEREPFSLESDRGKNV